MSAELPKPLPLKQFIIYVKVKYIKTIQEKNYLFDMLWASATGRTFSDDKGNATYPRWHEFISPKKEISKIKITKESIKAKFSRLKTKN